MFLSAQITLIITMSKLEVTLSKTFWVWVGVFLYFLSNNLSQNRANRLGMFRELL